MSKNQVNPNSQNQSKGNLTVAEAGRRGGNKTAETPGKFKAKPVDHKRITLLLFWPITGTALVTASIAYFTIWTLTEIKESLRGETN